MKTKYLLLGAIFAIFGMTAQGQVSEMYSQSFESGSPVTYTVSPSSNVRYSTTIRSTGGTRALKMVQTTTQDVEVILDTIDFTQNTTLRYIALRFDHICRVPVNSSVDAAMGMIYYKRANQTNWTAVSSQEYNQAGGDGTFSSDFASTSAFKENSYSDWMGSNVPLVNNNQWRSERFDLDNVMTSGVPASERKLLIKFVLHYRTLAGGLDTVNTAWWIDNIRVSASSERMVTPRITMVEYPTVERYPNSRGAHVELLASTSVSAGINSDSVYLIYRGGSDPTQHRLAMTPVAGQAGHFETRIPFYGYDTLMSFYCVARDATGNSTLAKFPSGEGAWVEYRSVRGATVQPGLATPGLTGTSSTGNFPFPWYADHRCEMVYDSALLRAAGYGPGAITSLRFTVASSVSTARTEPRFQIKMKNVPGNYTVQMNDVYEYPFTVDAMQVVYDSALTIPVMPSNLEQTIVFQDTFFYTGNDIIMQITYDGTSDHGTLNSPQAVNVKTIPVSEAKQTIMSWGGEASYGYNPFIDMNFQTTMTSALQRPAFVFSESALQPLLYDAGISALVDPNYDVPMTERPDSLVVRLKNYGERVLNGVRISYEVDDTVSGYYDWTGSLAGGAEEEVLITPSVNLAPGFHVLTVWVEDTVTSGSGRFRDHEPYNDTSRSEFVVCAGPMSGVRLVGGSGADFNNMEEFLFSLSRCGVDDSLVVRLAAGQYPPFEMPAVPGVSAEHYIVFESRNGQAVLYSDSTMHASAIVNLEQASHIRFRNIVFRRVHGPLGEMVLLGPESEDCRFEGCTFTDMLTNPVANLRINAMVSSGSANDLTVDNCTFTGGNMGVNVRGTAPDDYSSGLTVKRSHFEGQYSSAVRVEYESDVEVTDNEMFDVLSNSSYVLLLNGVGGDVNVERNKIYTSKGAGALALSDVEGTASRRALVANNMLVSADDGTANQLTTPLNVIQGAWIDVVYNSVQMTAPARTNVAAASFGGGVLNNSRFMNNIVASMDNMNFAFSYLPLSSTTNEVRSNDYYSNGTVMARRGSTAFVSIENWRTVMTDDTLSVSVNPYFMNSTLVDLRTYNRNLKSVGRPVSTVPTDIFGNVRGDSVTCPGAFEFSSLPYDFEPEALVSPETETCRMPGSVELAVRLRNSGIGVYDSTNTNRLRLSVRVNNWAVHTVTINETIPADDTVTVRTGYLLNLPSGTYTDASYTLRMWVSSADDPNQMNDTNVFTVTSHYHPAAPTSVVDSIHYSESDTITLTSGVDTWQVYGVTGAPRRPSTLYWYDDTLSAEPFHVGNTFVTGPLQSDTVYYVRQRRAMPIVRMTQVEILQAATAVGLTNPMPYWMLGSRKAAVQLTNIGDATAYLEGDTLMTVSPTAGLNAKYYRFGNVKIEPGESLVVQFAQNNTTTDTNLTIVNNSLGSTNVAYNSNIGFVYIRDGVVEDALPLNSVITATSTQAVKWSTLGVPSYVWSGAALTFPNNTAGLIRTSFNGGVGDWELSTASQPMYLGRTNESWVRYEDNGCDGDWATVRVGIIAPPAVDVEVRDITLPEMSCGLGSESVEVTVANYGSDTVRNLVLNYCAGADTVSDTLTEALLPHSERSYTFGTALNLAFAHDSTVRVRVWSDSIGVDPIRENDTTEMTVTSLYTPGMPPSIGDRQVQYATSDTITHVPTVPVMPVWYDFDMNPVDTGYTHISELLYNNGVRGMSYLSLSQKDYQVGSGETTNGNTAWPSPYQTTNRFVKQQYLYTAADLRAAGLEASTLNGISFFLDSIVGTRDSVELLDYTIKLGMTSDTIFTLTTAAGWKAAPTTVYYEDVLTLYQNGDKAWIDHPLSTAFAWDGSSTIVVEVSYNLAAAVSTGVRTRYTAKDNTTLHKAKNSAITDADGSLVKGNNRPNIKFSAATLGCAGPITTYNVTLLNMPQHDASLSWAEGYDTLTFNSCDTLSLPVKVRNLGSDAFDTLTLSYYLDDLAPETTVVVDSFAAGHTYDFTVLNNVMSPGRHRLKVVVGVTGDTIASNDTVVTTFTVRFCGGNYTIALNDATADYHSFGAAIDTLNQVGVAGPVTFQVMPGTYTEQVVINNVNGSSEVNTIRFVGQGPDVLLTASTSQAANYVMKIDGASNVGIENLSIVSRPIMNNVNYAHALVLMNDSNIVVNDCYVKVKGTIINANASCIVLQGNVSNLTITGTTTDSGYYAIKSVGAENNYSNIHINNNTFRNFASGGINLRDVRRVIISENEIRSSNSTNNRGLIGIYMAVTTDSMVIQKNAIYLVDERQGAKRGIQLENVIGTLTAPAVVVNNMIGTNGTGSAGLTPAKSAGIWIDSLSTYVNVLYNTVRVKGSNVTASSTASQLNNANNLTYAFWCGASPSQITVMNNILSNFGYGYAYYLTQPNTVTTSNYNAFYTQAANAFAVGAVMDSSLSDWQADNSTDGNSVFETPYFVSNDDLHLRMTNFAAKAQYNTEVVDDIDGNNRPQIPGPTIGAHEKYRLNHDMAVVDIIKPELPISLTDPNNVETDSVLVLVSFHNNGLSNESNVTWYAYIEGYETTTRSATRNLGTFVPAQLKMDSVMVPTSLGIIDTQNIHVVLVSNNDQALENNEMSKPFYLAPAFNLAALKVTATSDYVPAGCRMHETEIRINVKNEGSKDFPAGTAFTIGYHTEITNPANLTIPTLPDVVEQTIVLDNILPKQSDVWFTFDSPANLYPTGTFTNIKVRVRGWVNFQYDIIQTNDTTSLSASNSPIKDSYYTPAPPVGHDTTLAYGTWGEVTAEQENTRPIRWYRDSTAAPFYSPAQYNASKKWSNTPQYFHDSTYYLNALSDKQCPSYYSPVQVHVMAHKTRDMAVERMLAPLGGRVYMENDTVRVQIANYGTAPQSNFPITYQLKRGNNIIQTVTDTVRETIVADQTYIYTFDTLLNIPTPMTAQTYSLMVWTDLTNDATRRNDTLRTAHTFASVSQEAYNTFVGNVPASEGTKFDITRVSFNGIDLDIPPLDRSYTNLADYNAPDYPVLHVTRGTSDSIIIEVKPIDSEAQQFRCRGNVHIDFDRSGGFTPGSGSNEVVIDNVVFWSDSVLSGLITIPSYASLGYMRMRVKVMGYESESTDGHIIDFLLFVDDEAPETDLALTQIVSPRDYIIRDEAPKVIKFRMANRGQTTITNADIHYSFVGDTIDPTASGVVQWAGVLDPGTSTVVELPAHVFARRTTSLTIWHEMEGDVDSTNNILEYEYHRPLVKRAYVMDDFEGEDDWYAPRSYTPYTRNFWRRGMPHKTRIDTTYSGDNAWVTDLNSSIVTGTRGSVSYLYSPIINQSVIKPDTISFRLRRNLTNGSAMYIEYYNFERKWIRLAHDSIMNWYNDMENAVFTGTSPNSDPYGFYAFSITTTRLMNDLNENTQFRIVYTTPEGTSSASSFGEGCAVDDFYIGRARGKVDAGVIAFTQPEAPKYGQTIYPEVVVKNYGYDTLRNIRIGYTHHGSYLGQFTEVSCYIAPGATDTFQCASPFIITNDYPEEFHITAFTTRSDDYYRDNDTLSQMFSLMPLDKDISAEEFITPLDHVVAGDTAVKVTMRIRNFGVDPIYTATASYIVNGITRVDETLDFEELLGRPLESLEYYNYTFHRNITAPMGIMNITGIIKSPTNNYIYNDTISKRVEGIMSITDIAASAVIVDTSDQQVTYIGLVIDNVGARGVNNFEVGYWIDNDTSNIVRETYSRYYPVAALQTGYYRFNTSLPNRSSGYNIVSAFVHAEGDNDSSNDTTDVFASQFVDIDVMRVLVEENANNECRVFLELRNVGNIPSSDRSQVRMRTIINGGDSIITNVTRQVVPGDIVRLEFTRRIPKSPTRTYVGTGYIRQFLGDNNQANDQTSIIDVINYFEGVPSVNGENLVLEQNYPNPFSQQTTIPFTLPNAANVKFFVMDAMGHIVHTAERVYAAGSHFITVDMDAFAAGVYYYGIEVDGQRQMRKMILK